MLISSTRYVAHLKRLGAYIYLENRNKGQRKYTESKGRKQQKKKRLQRK